MPSSFVLQTTHLNESNAEYAAAQKNGTLRDDIGQSGQTALFVNIDAVGVVATTFRTSPWLGR